MTFRCLSLAPLFALSLSGADKPLAKLTKQGSEWKREELMAVRFVPLVAGKAEAT